MDELTTLRQVRQIAQFPLQTSLEGGELALLQRGMGGPYISVAAADLVGWGLVSGGTLRLSAGEAISWNLPVPVTLRAGPLGFSFSAPVAVSGNLDAVGLSVAGQPVATHNEVQQSFNYLLANSVSSWNGRTGAVVLSTEDILRAGGAPADNPVFSGRVVGPTHWNPALCDDTLVTSAWVQSALWAGLNGFSASPYFYGSPTAATPPAGDYSKRIANTIWVTDEIDTLRFELGQAATSVDLSGYAPLASPQFTGIPTAPTAAQTISSGQLATTAFVHAAVSASTSGVASFNGRTGAVTLTTLDVTTAGGAPISSPAFTGVPTAPTQAPGTNNTDIATTAFVAAAVAAAGGGVTSFNTRTGAVVLTAADVTAVGGALLASPTFTGVPAGPTAAPGASTTQLATTAFVTAALAASAPVTSFNGRTGAVTFQASDVSAVGGALLASPAFTGTPTAPTQTPGTNNTDIATTAFVAAAITAAAAGVSSFNGRTGAVTLTTADVTGAGGAPIASPTFTGVPAGPTATAGTNSTQLATTAFVTAAVGASVVSFNGRTGAVALQASDVSAVGGALLASPAFTGTPTAPTQAPGTNNTDLATCAFVAAAITAGGGVTTFNGRAGAVTLTTADITGVGGALAAACVAKAGDTMTGSLTIASGAIPALVLNATGAVSTWNPADKGTANTILSGGNLTYGAGASPSTSDGCRSVQGIMARKFYFELNAAGFGLTMLGVGLSSSVFSAVLTGGGGSFAVYTSNGHIWNNATDTAINIGTPSGGLVYCFAIDLVNMRGWIRAGGGNWNGSGTANPTTNTGGQDISWLGSAAVYALVASNVNANPIVTANFGATSFTQAVPSGFLSFNSSVASVQQMIGEIGGSQRWGIDLGDGTAETGSNAGSNFAIQSYTDAGALLATPLSIVRSSGVASFTQSPTAPTPAAADNSTKLATTAFVATAVTAIIRSYLAGLTLSTAGASATFSVAAGVAADSTNAVMLALASSISKTTGAWAVGTGNGALDTGTIANSTWYHVYLITRTDTHVVDVLISLSATAPTLPTSYTLFRRIGSLLTGGSGNWVMFVQLGDDFLWTAPPTDANALATVVAATLKTLTVPTGVQVVASIQGTVTGTAGIGILFSSPDTGGLAAGASAQRYSMYAVAMTGGVGSGRDFVRTNTSGQIYVSAGTTGGSYTINTFGWTDRRGRDN